MTLDFLGKEFEICRGAYQGLYSPDRSASLCPGVVHITGLTFTSYNVSSRIESFHLRALWSMRIVSRQYF